MPLETSPDKIEIKCSSVDNDLNYTVYIPESVYKDNPEIYLEAEHDGKTFVYKDKSPLELKTNKANNAFEKNSKTKQKEKPSTD